MPLFGCLTRRNQMCYILPRGEVIMMTPSVPGGTTIASLNTSVLWSCTCFFSQKERRALWMITGRPYNEMLLI